MPIDPNKVGKIYNALKEDGYTQSYEDFKAGFYGNDHYANRKKVFENAGWNRLCRSSGEYK